MGGGSKQTIGYRYYIGLHMAFCHGPVDRVLEVKVADKTAWPSPNQNSDVPGIPANLQQSEAAPAVAPYVNGRPTGFIWVPLWPTVAIGQVTQSAPIYINQPYLFGGDDREGGVQGFVTFHFGSQTEGQNPYLKLKLGNNVPAFRGVLTAVAQQVYVASMNPYIKPWSIYASRILAQTDGSAQWYAAKATISTYDMNPAHMIRELLTNRIYGKGRDVSEIDDTTFAATADTLFNEAFGLSVVWADTRDVDTFIQSILAHIDGVLFQDRVTNRWKLKLARNDYNINTIPVFDESNIIEMAELGRPLTAELVNQVTVTYWNRATRKNDTIIVDNQSLQDANGGQINPSDLDRTYISRTDLAARVAERELRTLGTSLLTGRMSVNRAGLNVEMGGVFKLSYARRKIESIACRVTTINYGTKDSENIIISFIEDIFALPLATYLGTNPTLWIDPRQAPLPALYRSMQEAPFWTVWRGLPAGSSYSALSPTGGFFMLSGSRQSSGTYTMQAWTRQGGAMYERRDDFNAACVARVAAATPAAETSTVTLDQITDPSEIFYGSYAQFLGTSELVMVLDYNYETSICILARGVLDTTPQDQPAGARLLFIENHQYVSDEEDLLGETRDARIVTQTTLGVLDLNTAPTDSMTFQARHYRPYPPGRFRIGGVAYPTDVYGADTVLTWNSRNRLQQTAYIVQQGEAAIAAEAGTTYTVQIRNGVTNAIARTATGVTLSTWTYTTAMAVADGILGDIIYEVWSVRDGYASWMGHKRRALRHGLGFDLGNVLGGEL